MPKAGDSFTVSLGNAHLDWGECRNPTNRAPISGEGYIRIPKEYARQYGVYNSNNEEVGLGFNEFNASSSDGYLSNVRLLAQGCTEAGDIYAKQFSVKGDLKQIGQWYANQNASTKNSVRVTWVSPQDVRLELL